MGLRPSHIVVRTLILRFSYLVSNTTLLVFSTNFPTNFSIQIPICFPARSKWVSAHPTYLPYTTPSLLPTPLHSSFPSRSPPPSSPLRLPSPFVFFSLSSPPHSPPFFSLLSSPFFSPSLYPFLILPSSPLPFFSSLLSFHTLPLIPLPLAFPHSSLFSFPSPPRTPS